jgi:hypothetical protein
MAVNCGTSLAAEIEGMSRVRQPISADIVQLVGDNEIHEQRTHIWMSDLGLALESKGIPGEAPHLIYLYNYENKKSWVITPEGRRYCELPVKDDQQRLEGGVLSTTPCLGFESVQKSETQWNDETVTVWECSKDKDAKQTQYYSERYGIVIMEDSHDGIVMELKNIKNASKLEQSMNKNGFSMEFKPLADYRYVSLKEFFFAKRPLEKYLEKE